MKYVDIYDVTPDYVYMGYTPGYLMLMYTDQQLFTEPVITTASGMADYYYARPYTWGFGIRYNPWFGWGFGVGFGWDWFNVSINMGNPYPWEGLLWLWWLVGWPTRLSPMLLRPILLLPAAVTMVTTVTDLIVSITM